MPLTKEYLKEQGYFHCPTPSGNQTTSTTSDANEVEGNPSKPGWTPQEVRYDPNLVKSLIDVLDDALGDHKLPRDFHKYFELVRNGQALLFRKFAEEEDAKMLLETGALLASGHFMDMLGYKYDVRVETNADEESRSRIDFSLADSPDKRVLVEVKSPTVFGLTKQLLHSGRVPFGLDLAPGARSAAQKVINNLCLYMNSHRIQCAILTCHSEWIFIQLHEATEEHRAYYTFSPALRQMRNSKPFRAFLGMLIATASDIDVGSRASLKELEVILEEEPPGDATDEAGTASMEARKEYSPVRAGSYNYSTEGQKFELLRPQQYQETPDILVSWSLDVNPANEWLYFYPGRGAKLCMSLGVKPVRLRLQREIGEGSTGCVYEAKLDIDGNDNAEDDWVYAMKTVKRGSSYEAKKRIARLYEEFQIYSVIEKARQNGNPVEAAPHCYGMYKTSTIVATILDYAGESLPGLKWDDFELEPAEKIMIFKALEEIHNIGINHRVLEPRNVLRTPDGKFKIIDYTASTLHDCPGVRHVKRGKICIRKKERGCPELNVMRKILLD